MTGLFFAVLTSAQAGDPEPAPVANSSLQDIARYRHGMMEVAKYHMKGSAAIVKGEVDRQHDLVMHATALNAIAKISLELYPKGSGPSAVKTDALAAIWTNWKSFETANGSFLEATEGYVEAAKTGDMAKILPAFKAVGDSCGGCHDDFRKEDD